MELYEMIYKSVEAICCTAFWIVIIVKILD